LVIIGGSMAPTPQDLGLPLFDAGAIRAVVDMVVPLRDALVGTSCWNQNRQLASSPRQP
jgi:hypothetical protein